MKWVFLGLMFLGLGVAGICIWFLTRQSIVLSAGFSETFLRAMRPIAIVGMLAAAISLLAFVKFNKHDPPF